MPSYQSYYFQSGVRALASSGSWEARDFAANFLAVRNLIPNVSAVLWRREALLRALESVPDLESWKLAGDWRLYLELLATQEGTVAYVAEPLNTHRRHESGVTTKLDTAAHLKEIERLHGVAADLLALPPPCQSAQSAYRSALAHRWHSRPRQTKENLSPPSKQP